MISYIFKGEPASGCRQAFRGCGFRLRCLLGFRQAQPSPTTLRATTILLALTAVCFTGCRKNSLETEKALSSETGSVRYENVIPADSGALEKNALPVDFDLSVMNANMVYATVFDMMVFPEKYSDKSIRMKGSLEIYDNVAKGSTLYSVIVADALSCCKTGIEFHYDFGNRVPPRGTEVMVTGKFLCTEIQDGISYNFVQAEKVEF